jgi:hypothetical protein
MYFINSYFTVAIYLALISIIIGAAYYWYSLVASESRLKRMMVACGIDTLVAIKADEVLKLNMDEVRTRCRHCPVTELCDRWLDGEAVASNSFCPNVWHFNQAAKTSG